MTDLLNIALELLVSNRQGVEELLQADCGALLPGMGWLLRQVAFVVKHQLGPHLAGLVACHHTQFTGAKGVLADEMTSNLGLCVEWRWLLKGFTSEHIKSWGLHLWSQTFPHGWDQRSPSALTCDASTLWNGRKKFHLTKKIPNRVEINKADTYSVLQSWPLRLLCHCLTLPQVQLHTPSAWHLEHATMRYWT